jgi:hypothetical protein
MPSSRSRDARAYLLKHIKLADIQSLSLFPPPSGDGVYDAQNAETEICPERR